DEIQVVNDIGDWLRVNGEAIYSTRPWKILGEGPSLVAPEKNRLGGEADVQSKPFTAEDVRFTQSKDGKALYAIILAIPKNGEITIKSLASNSSDRLEKIGSVRM